VLTGADDRTHRDSPRDALLEARVGRSAPAAAQAAQGA